MREVLFRGKAINRDKGYHRTKYKNGDWVYGLITKLYDEEFETLPAEMTNEYGVSGIEIDHKTVGQYTGVTDVNGQKIFEGDVVEVYCATGELRSSGSVVHWDDFFSGWYADEHLLYGRSSVMSFKIIGNVYDGPELLKGSVSDA